MSESIVSSYFAQVNELVATSKHSLAIFLAIYKSDFQQRWLPDCSGSATKLVWAMGVSSHTTSPSSHEAHQALKVPSTCTLILELRNYSYSEFMINNIFFAIDLRENPAGGRAWAVYAIVQGDNEGHRKFHTELCTSRDVIDSQSNRSDHVH